MKEKVIKIIFDVIDEINLQSDNSVCLNKSKDTVLLGQDGGLDSLGLINLIVAVEQNVEDEFDITITLADEKAMSQDQSPFGTVKTLAEYTAMLIEENNSE